MVSVHAMFHTYFILVMRQQEVDLVQHFGLYFRRDRRLGCTNLQKFDSRIQSLFAGGVSNNFCRLGHPTDGFEGFLFG